MAELCLSLVFYLEDQHDWKYLQDLMIELLDYRNKQNNFFLVNIDSITKVVENCVK